LHRAGRTGRCGKKGTVINLYHKKDEKLIEKLNKSFDNNESVKIKGSMFL